MKKYQPSNGSEGVAFYEAFCDNCKFCGYAHDGVPIEPHCETLMRSLTYDVTDDQYPEEFTYDANNKPTCTKHQFWDWANGAPEIEIFNPNQLDLFNQLT